MANVGGVFLVLLFGTVGAIIMGIFEFIWNVKKVAVEEKVKRSDFAFILITLIETKKLYIFLLSPKITPGEAFVAEVKFLVKFWVQTKPVKVSKSSKSSSSGEGGFGRAISTQRSMGGSFARLDMLEKFDKDDNPQNNRGNNHKIL